jgi:hypothetical protein
MSKQISFKISFLEFDLKIIRVNECQRAHT